MSRQVEPNFNYIRIYGPDGIMLECDAKEIYPDNPGNGTPLLLTLPSGDTVTFHCACCEGETADGEELTTEQKEWVNSIEGECDDWLVFQSNRIEGLK